jgi:hypothetical protein
MKVVGKPKARRTVAPTDVPSFLAVVCGESAFPTLAGQDLLETLVARDEELSRQGLARRQEAHAASRRDFFGRAAV